MKANIRSSFAEQKETGKKEYEFRTRAAQNLFSEQNTNYWAYGMALYATAKLIDQHPLTEFAKTPRDILERSIITRGHPFVTHDVAHRTYDSVQYEHLIRLANHDRIVLEHIVVLNMSQAIELILKALQAHAAKMNGNQWTFDRGHKLPDLYSKLPRNLRTEIETEFEIFTKKYHNHVTKTQDILRSTSTFNPDIDKWAMTLNQIIDDLNAGGYSYVRNEANHDPINMSKYKAHSIRTAIKEIPDIETNRYGPKAGPDPYSTSGVEITLIIGRFFYEHLFPTTPKENSQHLPIQHWMGHRHPAPKP